MELEDRKLTLEERLLLIQEIANNGGLYGVNELLNKINTKNIPEPVVENNIEDNTTIKQDNSINGASIYAKEALPLVKADLEEQKERIIAPEDKEEKVIEKPLVRERVPNPYSDSRTVIPDSK